MTWKTLREALEMAAASGFDAGEDGIAVPSRSPKKERGMARSKLVRETLPTKEDDASREMIIAPPNGLPRPAVIISLVVDNSGRTTQGRKLGRPAYRVSPEMRASELKLRVV